MKVGTTRLLVAATIAVVGAVGLSACSSGGSGTTAAPSASSKLSGEITLPEVHELTGSAGFAGASTQKGIDLALEEVNSSGFLGSGVTLKVNQEDTASNTDTATTDMSKALADPTAPVVLGPLISTAAQAVAPLALRAKKPVVMGQALGPGIANAYVYRVTPAEDSYYQLDFDYAKKQGVKSISVIYDAGSSRMTANGTTLAPDFAKKNGMKILSTTAVPTGTADFTATASKIAGEKPDAVLFFITGTSQVTAVQQLRRAGYTGIFLANQSLEGALATAGDAADGAVWSAPFSVLSTNAASQKFIKAFQAKYNAAPDVYAADGYDQIYLVARALKAAGSTDPAAVQTALQAETKKGYEGAQGKVTFKGGDAQGSGILIQWKSGTKTVLAPK
jgi:branched-chain amino acid transport system substrate-binding protein